MAVARVVDRHLGECAVAMEVLPHPRTETLRQAVRAVGVDPDQVARALLVVVGERTVMVILPLNHVLDFAALEAVLGAPPRLLPAGRTSAWFPDCEHGCVPPLPAAYGLEAVFDESLFAREQVIFEAGSRSALVRVDAAAFARLAGRALRAVIAVPAARLRRGAGTGTTTALERLTPGGLRERIERIYQLPPLPGHARALLALRDHPDADAAQLAALVEQDPSLAAQVLRHARSPLYGYRGSIDTVAEAVARVLGFDQVLDLALGLAALRPFTIPADGPLGLDALWRHATLSAALARRLAPLLPRDRRPAANTAYLCGLLHNFGYLVLGQLFQPEYYLLNRMAAANPETAVADLEKGLVCRGQAREVLCAGHAEVGAWLLESWGMPAPVIAAARAHHQEQPAGPHGACVDLVQLTDRLLKAYGIGDAAVEALPEALLARYGLNADALVAEVDVLMPAWEGRKVRSAHRRGGFTRTPM